MINPSNVLAMLCPNVELAIVGDKYEDINWFGADPAISKEEYEAGFAQYEVWKAEQDSAKAAQKAALLDRLGITEDEAKLLLA
jgi:hypothetical protein